MTSYIFWVMFVGWMMTFSLSFATRNTNRGASNVFLGASWAFLISEWIVFLGGV